jgi:7,8-dihydropterin-6-yl-methyl-4-(beta-D-ribofuranosyl)aminobenzene 5'-phosphate synthase
MNAPAPFTPPVVDELKIRVVVDSSYERFLPKTEHPLVNVEHVGRVPGHHLTTLACEWGLSLHLETAKSGERAEFLLDFGYTPDILNRNFDLLGIDPAKLKGLILSHGHRDHYGGLDGFVGQYRAHMRDDIALYVGGETVFREKWIKEPDSEPMSWGAIDRMWLKAQGVGTVCCDTPHDFDSAFTTGYIERTSFEEVTGGTLVDEDDEPEHYTDAERAGALVRDLHPDEHATCFVVQGKGLVVISSCGHAGIINTVRTAKAVTNVDKVHAVIGGFHLGMAKPDYLQHSLDELTALDPDLVIPMHCTGAPFIAMLKERMPDKVVASNVGSRFSFAA